MTHLDDSVGINRCTALAGSACLLAPCHIRAGLRVRLDIDLRLVVQCAGLRVAGAGAGTRAVRRRGEEEVLMLGRSHATATSGLRRWPWMRRPAAEEPDSTAIALARELVAETRAELARADAKASTLLAGGMVAIGIVVSALAANHWSLLGMRLLPAVLAVLAALCAVVGLAVLLAVIYPRCRPQNGRLVLGYFDHVREHDVDELADALRARARGPELEHLVAKLANVAAIAGRKFALMRFSVWTLAAAGTLAAAAVLTAEMAR